MVRGTGQYFQYKPGEASWKRWQKCGQAKGTSHVRTQEDALHGAGVGTDGGPRGDRAGDGLRPCSAL